MRGKILEGCHSVSPCADGNPEECEYGFLAQVDLGGQLPVWAVNLAAEREPVSLMERLEKAALCFDGSEDVCVLLDSSRSE